MGLFGIIIERNAYKGITLNRFANFAGDERREFFGLLMKITTK